MIGKRSSALFCLISVFAFAGVVAYAVNADSPNHSAKRVGDVIAAPSGPGVPNPGDTILYDDGNPYYFFQYIGADMYWAVRFTPAENCTVKEAHFGIYNHTGTVPPCTLFVWDDNSGEPGTAVHSQVFTPDGMVFWNYIPIGTSITYTAGTDFWLGFFIPEPSGADTTCILTDSLLNNGDRSYVNINGVWYDGASETFPGDLLIRAYVEYVSAANHDVGPDSITNPPDTVMPDSTYFVTAWVHNWGDTSEVFNVECTISPGAYVDTSMVMGLAAGADVQVAFTDWVVPPDDSTDYTMCVVTLLGTDTSPRNDTLCVNRYAVAPAMHDVGVDSILIPPDTVEAGAGYDPSAWVHNYGNQTEIFQVLCEIDSGGYVVFADTEAVFNLDPDYDQQVVFATWTVPPAPGVTYNTCIWTALVDDAVPANDTLCKSSMSITGVTGGLNTHSPIALALRQNVPNPFSSATAIAYEIPSTGRVNISIYDAAGGLVRILTDEEAEAGYYSVLWDGKSSAGSSVPEGVYFCKLSLGSLEATTKLVLVR